MATITLADIDLTLSPASRLILQQVARRQFAPEAAYRLRLAAEHLSLIQGFEELLSLEAIAVEPFPHQIKTAQTVLRRLRGRGLLCDEVGLGKTIEACLVLKEYLLRGLVKKVLVLTPPGLTEQWQEELSSKFRIDNFIRHDDPVFRAQGEAAWRTHDRVIASLATARLAANRPIIQEIPYDLVIVDEAHHIKNRNSVSWQFVNNLQKKYILFLTATPVQNKLDELYNLITVLKPGQLKTEKEFRKAFVVRGDPRSPKNRGMLRELLADVMVRNTRDQVNIKLPRRRATTIRLHQTPAEEQLYAAVTTFIRMAMADDNLRRGVHRLTLLTLQREIGSSPLAAAPTLAKIAGWSALTADQRVAIKALAAQARTIQQQAKVEALLKLLKSEPNDKVIIFTHFLETLHHLHDQLTAAGHAVVAYHGGLSVAEKNQAIADFTNDRRILLSTEAAGEGRNLQFCWRMVNYDLPWNPMRIEQRIGRIHRIGQTHEVQIYNLAMLNTVEDYILQILDSKINMFELVVGEVDMILGNLAEEREFEEIIFDLWTQAQSQTDVERTMAELGEALLQARTAYQETKNYDEALFGQDFGVE